jgi:hypothetical protein
MSQPGPKIFEPNLRRGRWGRVARDVLLLPPALVYVIVEQVFWRGAKRLLRQAARIKAIEGVQAGLQRLPPAAVLPMFLVPEIFSHVGGFWASALLYRRAWVAALLVGLFVKGTAVLVEVWIYQSCETTLLSVRWFAWLHNRMMDGLDWVDSRTKPARDAARRLLTTANGGVSRRFAALRSVLTRRLGFARK